MTPQDLRLIYKQQTGKSAIPNKKWKNKRNFIEGPKQKIKLSDFEYLNWLEEKLCNRTEIVNNCLTAK